MPRRASCLHYKPCVQPGGEEISRHMARTACGEVSCPPREATGLHAAAVRCPDCRCIEDNTPKEGTSRRGEVGAIGRRLQVGRCATLPSFGTQTRWPGLLLLVWYYYAILQV